jgi:hypothetical protein
MAVFQINPKNSTFCFTCLANHQQLALYNYSDRKLLTGLATAAVIA